MGAADRLLCGGVVGGRVDRRDGRRVVRPVMRLLSGRWLAVWVACWTLVAVVVGCTPAEVAVFESLDPVSQQAVVDELARRSDEQARRQVQAHPFLVCVRAHESDTAGGYLARNPMSSASGAYQYLDSTWRTVSAAAGFPGYARAFLAPWWVQDAVTFHRAVVLGERWHWNGTGC